jgi:ribonucleoside-diphosphate reductase alpha chain
MLYTKRDSWWKCYGVRKLDYSIQISKLFYERFIRNESISLFSPHDVPGLSDAFGLPNFDDLYIRYETNSNTPRKTLNAQDLILNILKERAETGRIYIMNIDHCNDHSSFKDKIWMSNLCQEITLPTKPLDHIDDPKGEIALCILSAVNLGKIKFNSELEELCDLSVRSLDELIDYQDYPIRAAQISTRNRRSLGIGYIGLAHYLARNGQRYEDKQSWQLVHDLTEAFQYYLLKSSNQLAKEKGKCGWFDRTKYADGILPIDTYKKEVDEIISHRLNYDWESLRASIIEHGLRNSTLSAQMPSESSSVVSNETNGIEPPRAYLSVKKSKKGVLKQIVPQYSTLKNNYTLLWDMPGNTGYINIVAVMQKFFDQAISGNWSYNPEHYPDNEVPTSVIAQDFLNTYKFGWKTSYYQNTYDVKKDSDDEDQKKDVENLLNLILTKVEEEDDCGSCKI